MAAARPLSRAPTYIRTHECMCGRINSLADFYLTQDAWNDITLLNPVVNVESAGPFKASRKANRIKVQGLDKDDRVVPQSADVPDVNQVTRQVTVDGACDPSASTSFHNDGNEKRSEVPQAAPQDQELLDSGRSHTPQEVRDFLAKPIRLGAFLFTTASAAGTVLATYTLDKVGLFDNNPIWRNKIAGNMCIRGNIHLRMQVNANPFQQGRLLMCFEPMKQCSTVVYSRLAHRRSITQLPHVQYDICMDSEAEIVIPYLTLGTHYNLVSGENPWGVVNVIVYSPINQGTGSSNAEVTIWAHFSELEVCTPSLVYNQSADVPKRKSGRPTTSVTKKAVGSKEADSTMGPITRMLGTVGTVSQIAGGVPLLSGVAGTVEWAANLAKGVASSFGWSKPLTSAPNMRMNPTANMYQQNSTGVDNAYNLGLLSENKVSPYPALGGTEVDEMSIDFIKQVQSFNADFTWADTNVVGDTLYTFEAFPLLVNASAPVAGVTTVEISPLGGLADLFEFYRGSIIVTLKFVKTCFHSGRLAVSFNPGFLVRANPAIPTATVDFTLDQSVYLNRDIIDLKDSHEFEFVLPWTSTIPYLPVGQAFGKMKIHVVNPLRMPDTCANSVNCIVEVRGAPDFEFMRPKPFRYFPIGISNPNPPSFAFAPPEEEVFTEDTDDIYDPVYPQMDDVPKIAKTLGTSSWDPLSTRVAELCVGEQIRSLKQLLSRAICMNDDRQPSNVTTPSWPYLIDAEFKAFVTSGRPATATPYTAPQMVDYYSLFASLYAFSRGGVVWRFVPLAVTASDRRQYKVALQYDTGGLTFTTAGDFRIADSSIFEYEFTDQLAVYVPQYNPTTGRLNVPMTNSINAALPYVDYSRLIVFSENTTFANFNGTVWRSGADDTHMSYFLGFPRMAYGA